MKVFLSSTRITGSPSDSYVSIKLPWTRVPSALQTASLAASCCCAVAIMSATQARYIFPAKYRFRLIQQKLHQNRDVSRHTSPSPCPGSRVATYSVYSYTVIHLYSVYIIHRHTPSLCLQEASLLELGKNFCALCATLLVPRRILRHSRDLASDRIAELFASGSCALV